MMSIGFFHNLRKTLPNRVRIFSRYYDIFFRTSILTNVKRYDIIKIFTLIGYPSTGDRPGGDPKMFCEAKIWGKRRPGRTRRVGRVIGWCVINLSIWWAEQEF